MHKEAEEGLIRSGIVSVGDLHSAKEKSRINRVSILLNLLEGRSAESCRAITESLAQHYKIPMLSMKKIVPPKDLMKLCNAKQARKLHFLPIATHGNQVVIGMVDPLDLHYSDEIRAIFQKNLKQVFISLDDFEHSYYRFFRKGASLPEDNPELMNTIALKEAFLGSAKGDPSHDDRDVIAGKFAARIVTKALESNASSFSIEPQQDVCLVNITLEGTEYNLYRFSISNHKALVEAMMRLAKIEPPYDDGIDHFSRCQVRFRDNTYILAYSFRQSPTGERVVVHILDPRLGSITLDKIGLGKRENDNFENAMDHPGLIMVTGPTGSGKSVLLQTMTRHAVAKGKSTFTVEDIVGLKIDGARQFQLKPDGPTKSQILAAIRKKNADVIVIDEIDSESFPAAIECAEAGALVLLSITAPDIKEALSRMLCIGIPRSRIAPLLKIACTHTMVRKICPECKTADSPHSTAVSQWQIPDHLQFYTGVGCDACQGSGYQGTVNLTEMFHVSENIAEMIRNGASGPEMFQQARYEGMLTLIEKAVNRVIDGTTSLHEALASVPFSVPFSVRGQMRMGRVIPPVEKRDETAAPESYEAIGITDSSDEGTAGTVTDFGLAGDSETAVESNRNESPPPSHAEAEPLSEENGKANVLLVDDSPVTLEFTRHILEVSGYFDVDTTGLASKALEMLEKKQYHLVITDQEMPEQTGLEFIESIRQHPSLNGVGTILLTGNLNEMSALGSGADGYIGKPTDPEVLIARAKSISDIYKRLSARSSAKKETPASIQIPSSSSAVPGKVDFTEKDLEKISGFELDIPAAKGNPAEQPPHEPDKPEEDTFSEFDNLFK